MRIGGGESEDRWFTIHAFRIGKPEQHRVAILFNDITDRKQAEEKEIALSESEERWRLALESINFATWELNLETSVAFHDLRHDQIFGYKELQPSWTLENKLSHIITEDRERVKKAFEHPDEKDEVSVETQIRWNDGSIHWIYLHGRFQYNTEGKAVKIIGIVADITERKEAEQALKESKNNLQELNDTKDKFFSIIAHDLKSPFNTILGFSEMLVEKSQAKADYDEIEKFATIIQTSAERVMNLLNNLFEWSKLQTGRLEFHPTENDIVKIIHETAELLNELAGQKSITIYQQTPDSYKIMIDIHMISTVIRNLLSNAIKFTKTYGKIIISVVQKENELEISISDNGVGIKPEIIEKLFGLDKNISTTGTRGEEGSGLGLMLCKDFISKHGGRIWAESEINEGSKFSFTLPLVPPQKKDEAIKLDYHE